jgi:hypothetical protein
MHGALQSICVCAMVVASLLFLVGNLFRCAHVQAETRFTSVADVIDHFLDRCKCITKMR